MDFFKVSIIIPVYNVEKYLSPCLDSLISQTLDEIEIVAVNDGSTDGSLQILEAYQQRYPQKVFVYSTENHGVSHARNYGFFKSRGEYVWFVDSDDYVELDACRLLYEKATTDHNDLVLFRYYNVDEATGQRKEYINSCYNQNFTVAQKPYELPAVSPYPWIKFIHRNLFEGLHFPEGIRFEDLPVAYLLAAKARSIGYIDECFYNYRKNVGFLSKLTEATLHIKDAIIFLKKEMEKLGFLDRYLTEIDFIAVRHFFYRFWKLLTNYETGKKALKLRLVNELFDYMETNIPEWEENHYVRYSLPPHIARMMYLYGNREEMIGFLDACDGMSPQQQKNWIKEYKTAHEKDLIYCPAEMIGREKTAAQFYKFAYTGSLAPDPEQIFLESQNGNGISSWLLNLLIYLLQNFGEHRIIISLVEEKHPLLLALLNRYLSVDGYSGKNIALIQPGSEEYGKALALSGYLVTDGPLPYYFQKEAGQFFLLYCGRTLYPETILNTPASTADIGLWQHSMFLADCLYFNNEQNRDIYMRSCMTLAICPTPYVLGTEGSFEIHPDCFHRDRIRRNLQMDGKQTILYAPLLPGTYIADTFQTFRDFMAALYLLDQELDDSQKLYLHLESEQEVDFSEFEHIQEMPRDFDTVDFAAACDIFLSDYHRGLYASFPDGTRILRLLCGTFRLGETNQEASALSADRKDGFFPEYPEFHNVPELARCLRALAKMTAGAPETSEKAFSRNIFSAEDRVSSSAAPESTVSKGQFSAELSYPLEKVMESLLNGRPLPEMHCSERLSGDKAFGKADTEVRFHKSSENISINSVDATQASQTEQHRPRVLFFTGRKLSQSLVRDFNALATQAPDKEFWLAFNDFRNTDASKYLASLAPQCSFLPLKPDPEKGRQWKFISALTSRIGLTSLYPLPRILALGKKECEKCLGNATFDEVVITSTDSIKTVATLLGAAPVASYSFDSFNPKRYSTSRPYRHQIAFLCKLLKDVGSLELPEELAGMKFAQSSGGHKNKETL